MSKLIAKGITKTYNGKNVLHGVDLELESGKIYGMIGRNGAGVAFFGKEKAGEMVIALMDSSVWWLLILGAVSYVLAGIFALAVTRKIEVRM